MKGTYKRRKGQFTARNQPALKELKTDKSLKVKPVKRTYIRLTKNLLQKTRSIPRSVKISMANNQRQDDSENSVFLRPTRNGSNKYNSGENSENKVR